MHFTRVLHFYKRYSKVPGQLYAGKNKIHPHITTPQKRAILRCLLMEQENLEILSRPCITKEQSSGHMKAMYDFPTPNFRKMRAGNMPPHMLFTDQLEHLNVSKKWK
ncbi:ribosomal protein 63, mitochondrial-like [Gigantopelta aegis]|uniref:ribosomal protein 63, mitochondrial-like n=1 Tax=Gigantopelta aegis TaxID=1735272 RepID=UPI001B88B725|nr:ribosomal protein 63, mitochondrial-like [Gigantopelta aegis]